MLKRIKTYIIFIIMIHSVNIAIASNAFDPDNPANNEEGQTMLNVLVDEINQEEEQRARQIAGTLSDKNLQALHDCFDGVHDQMLQSEITNLRKYVKRTTGLICCHSAIKGWLEGGSLILAGSGAVVLGLSALKLFDLQTQSTLTSVSTAILLGATLLRFLGFQSKKAFLVMSRDMQLYRGKVGKMLAASREEIQRRQAVNAQPALVENNMQVEVLLEPDDDEISKGKEEEVLLEVVVDDHNPPLVKTEEDKKNQ